LLFSLFVCFSNAHRRLDNAWAVGQWGEVVAGDFRKPGAVTFRRRKTARHVLFDETRLLVVTGSGELCLP
jgi:hypothetical protein